MIVLASLPDVSHNGRNTETESVASRPDQGCEVNLSYNNMILGKLTPAKHNAPPKHNMSLFMRAESK